MPLISIILPAYNGEKYISKAIESCLGQSLTDFELIIINDCSGDNTLAIAGNFAGRDPRIRIISNSTNQQLPRSLNIGFSNATGRYLTWIADDNYFASQALEQMAGELDKDSQADIVYSSYRFINEKGKVLESIGGVPEKLLFKCIVGGCFLYRRKVHEQLNGYSEDKFRTEDMDFWLRAAALFRFKFIDNPDLFCYRKHTHSLTFGIYKSKELYERYRQDYFDYYQRLFNKELQAGLPEEDIRLHIELFFEDFLDDKNRNFDLAGKIIASLDYLAKLTSLNWAKIHFDKNQVHTVVAEKRNRIVSLIINDLVFERKKLAGQNPSIAAHLNKPISWYYREYEVLPAWYKRFGHILKVLQKNRSFRSLFTNKMIQ